MKNPRVDDDMILNILYREAAIDNFSLSDCHPVMVHFLQGELVIGMQSLGCFPQHQLELAKSTPPNTRISCL